MRQPIRAFILSILIGAAAFAFVARATEFFIVRDEITRIEAFYRAVGVLSPLSINDITTDHDVTEAMEVIENSRHVAISDARTFVQGAFADMFNISTRNPSGWDPYFNPVLHGFDVPLTDHYFYGSLLTPVRLIRGADPPELSFRMNVYELVMGDISTLRAGGQTFTNERGQSVTIGGRYNMRLFITEEERDLFNQGLWQPFGNMRTDQRALFRATLSFALNLYGWFELAWLVRPLVGVDGLRYTWWENSDGGGWFRALPNLEYRSETADMMFYVDARDEEATHDLLYYLQDEFALHHENLSSVTVIGTKDMTAMPRVTDRSVTRLVDTPLSPAGRWLTYEDYLLGNPVVVLPAPLAIRRDISIGDHITVTLRDNPRPTWIDTPTDSGWARGIENWWDSTPEGWWSLVDGAHEDWQSFPTHELTLEVVGIYWLTPPIINNFTSGEIFIPLSLIPESFGWDDSPQLTGMYSFALTSPRLEEAFLRDMEPVLYAMGFRASFMPNLFEHLAAATDPIRLSITINLIVFGAASALILAFAALLYIRQWRKTVAITRALGIPRKKVLGQLFAPVSLLWIPFMIAGSVAAWFFAINQAETALATIDAYETAAMPGIFLLPVLCGLLITFVVASVFFGGYGVVRRPVLEQLQGEAKKRRKHEYVDPGVVPEGIIMGDFELAPLPAISGFSTRLGSNLRHSIRLIFRTPIKTALALLLALIFVFSLGWLHNTIEFTEAEIERLWATTIIDAEILVDYEIDPDGGWIGSFISPDSWNAIAFSGFLYEAYLESPSWYSDWDSDNESYEHFSFIGVSHLEGLIDENTRTPIDEQFGILCDNMEIEFLPGFCSENFVYIPGEPAPVIIPRSMEYPRLEFSFGEMQIIGVFDGGLMRAIGRFGDVYILPFEHHRAIFSGAWPYYGEWSMGTYYPVIDTARFTINPARNREIDRFRELVQPTLSDNSFDNWWYSPALLLDINDDVIHSVIMPMEDNLSLLRVLYPIAIGVAFLLAFGLSLLTMLQSAKNAAIMRVLGKPRAVSQFMLCAEQIMVCVAGILLGLLTLFIIMATVSVTPLALAGVYLGGAIIGSVIGVFVISMRPPLDLLQVRE